MARRIPPLPAIRAFEAAARLGSFRLAAEELCLSPSAISHQVRALEEYLDTALFRREGNRVVLTLTGQTYMGRLTTLLDGLERSTQEASSRESPSIRVLSTPGFAARWLVPRLGRFALSERVRLRVSEGAPDTDFARNDADVVIHWTDTPVEGVVVEPLMQSGRYPVASPDLVEREGIRHPADLARVTLLHDEVQDAWEDWFHRAGVEPPRLPRGPRFPHCELSTTAAEKGQGVSLAYDAMVRDTLGEGALVRLFETDTLPFVIYSVAYPEERAGEPALMAFRDWLFEEVARQGTRAGAGRTAAE